jgi:integrase
MSWSLNVRVRGARRRLALGRGLRLAEARKAAEEARSAIGRGEDPGEARRRARERSKAAAQGIGTLGAVVRAYYEQGPGASLRSGDAARALIERVFADQLMLASLDIRTTELQLLIDGWRSKSTASRVAACFRPVMRWAARRGLMVKGDSLEAPPQAPAEQRALSRDEVAHLMRILRDRPHDLAARFMLLTAARRDEVCGATWGEIKDGVWTIPAARRKDTRPNARRSKGDHVIPLSGQALALLERQEAGERDAFVFVGERGARLTNWPRWSARIEKRLGFDVSPHALRRTCATLAGDLGQPPHVVSALLGHRSIGGALHAGYNQSRYGTEVANALQMVADLVDALKSGNVVAMREAQGRRA